MKSAIGILGVIAVMLCGVVTWQQWQIWGHERDLASLSNALGTIESEVAYHSDIKELGIEISGLVAKLSEVEESAAYAHRILKSHGSLNEIVSDKIQKHDLSIKLLFDSAVTTSR